MKGATPADVQRAAGHIMGASPFGGVCGVVCPDKFCMASCTRGKIDKPIEIPSVQATIVQRARELGLFPSFPATPAARKQRVAIIGSGPSGLAAVAVLAQHGYHIDLYERHASLLGGVCNTIPEHRLPRHVLEADIAHTLALGEVSV